MAKQRSPNYPAIGLREALETAQAIYDKEKKTQVSGEVMAKAMGYTSLSGPARVKISALKKYGLLEGDERKGIRISDLAMRMLFAPNGVEQLGPLREAALRPELFKLLYTNFRDGSDEAMRAHLITKLDFSPLGAKQVIAAFRDTYSFAGLDRMVYTDFEMPDKGEVGSMQTATRIASAEPSAPSSAVAVAVSPRSWTWPLSVPRGVNAQLMLTGNFTKSDITRLKKQIEFLEESFDEEG